MKTPVKSLVFALCCASLASVTAQADAPPRRIVSVNLCTDQYLLALADRSQIAALTSNADKPEMSAAAAQAHGLRLLGQSAEDVLDIAPDLIIGMPARSSALVAALRGQQYRTLDMHWADSLDDIKAQIRAVASAVGHPDRGKALIARMEHELAALPKPGHGRVAAYYQRRGFLTGTGTLVDDLMSRAGLVNLAARLHKPALSQISIESMIAAQPDFIIVETETDRVTDQGTEMLHHPALEHIARIHIPQAWTVCGGPAYVQAARSLVAQVAAAQSSGH
ncbi:ABC transporter substrate-binding protein [Novosphingobium sp.]|uniref:ABC transporter substrate-binding protein n=1 Tax=Novosphingobium sp. TaxID=1874826 RepID=UPI003D1148A8